MLLLAKKSWINPLEMAKNLSHNNDNWAFFYSGLKNSYTGSYSYLCLQEAQNINHKNFDELKKYITIDKDALQNAWFGYLSYELKNTIEDLPATKAGLIDFPLMSFHKFNLIIEFDHNLKQINIWGISDKFLKFLPFDLNNYKDTCDIHDTQNLDTQNNFVAKSKIEFKNLSSNMSKAQYLENVSLILQAIKNGDLYQANLTRKINGQIVGDFSPFMIFYDLCNISPAPYSAFIKIGNKYIISSSPERFIKIDKNGNINSLPIKGTIRRGKDKSLDLASREILANSPKDKAENLMIVDLMRNDIAKTSQIGSVKVDKLFAIETFATLHHMYSSINGIKLADKDAVDVIKSCFPPGSMTGTPKIKAMELCSQLEKISRNVYSGAIGWLGGDGSADFSVVIRTILIDGNNFEFQAGGAIVADSVPENEWQEIITKSLAICAALKIDLKQIDF